MRVADLDRDMSDVFPTGITRDSLYLFERMTAATLGRARAAAGRRVLDVASGVGQDTRAVAAAGALAVGVEPSARMSALARLEAARAEGPQPHFVRAWSDALPFAGDTFDASYCKGSLDHFDRPDLAIAEMARVTKPDGRVVLAVANFESLALRWARGVEELRETRAGAEPARGRRHHDVPSDHFTRYDPALVREQAAGSLELELVEGVSLAWGVRGWSRTLEALPPAVAHGALQALDWLARRAPSLADVIVLAGRPRRARAPRVVAPSRRRRASARSASTSA
jgi:SAM-dependent methyltransferase